MAGSALTPFPYIGENSEATPGLFNNLLSILSQNIAEANDLSNLSSNVSTLGIVTINANSNVTDYIHFHDSSNQRSDYILGSKTGGTADGLNLFDVSGNTLIATFSKQSVRFWQNVIAPVFDTGGATFNVKSYGARGDGVTDDTAAFQLAISAVSAINGGIVVVPSSQSAYVISSTLTLVPNLALTGGGGFNPTLSFSGGSSYLFSFLGTAEGQGFNTFIGNMTVNTTTPLVGVACRLRNFANAYFDAVSFSNWSIALWPDWGLGVFVSKCQFVLNNRGINIGGFGTVGGIRSTNTPFMDTVYITDTAFSSNKLDINDYGTSFSLGCLDIANCTFFEPLAGISGKTEFVHLTNRKGIAFTNNWVEGQKTNRYGVVFAAVDSDGSATTQVNGALVANCDFLFTGGAGNTAVFIERGNAIGVTHNTFEMGAAGQPVRISENTLPCLVANNAYLAYPDNPSFTNPIISTNSIHQILELSNYTSSLGTLVVPRLSLQSGTQGIPSLTFGSELSLGFYASAKSNLALSYGTLSLPVGGKLVVAAGGDAVLDYGVIDGLRLGGDDQVNTIYNSGRSIGITTDSGATIFIGQTSSLITGFGVNTLTGASIFSGGKTILPPIAFMSEQSLGWYRSANSTMALSYGSLAINAAGAGAPVFMAAAGGDAILNYAVLDGLRISGDDQVNSIYNSGRSLAITADSGVTIFIGRTSSLITGIAINTTTGASTISGGIILGVGSTRIPAISSMSSLVGAFIVQGSASSFTGIAWAAVKIGDHIITSPFQGGAASSVSSGLVWQSLVTVNGQIEFRLSNVSTLVQNQSSQSWIFTRITAF